MQNAKFWLLSGFAQKLPFTSLPYHKYALKSIEKKVKNYGFFTFFN